MSLDCLAAWLVSPTLVSAAQADENSPEFARTLQEQLVEHAGVPASGSTGLARVVAAYDFRDAESRSSDAAVRFSSLASLDDGVFAISTGEGNAVLILAEAEALGSLDGEEAGDWSARRRPAGEGVRLSGRADRRVYHELTHSTPLQVAEESAFYRIPGVRLVIPCDDPRGAVLLSKPFVDPITGETMHRLLLNEHDASLKQNDNGTRGSLALWHVALDWSSAYLAHRVGLQEKLCYSQDVAAIPVPADLKDRFPNDEQILVICDGANEELVAVTSETGKTVNRRKFTNFGWPWCIRPIPDSDFGPNILCAVIGDRGIAVVSCPTFDVVASLTSIGSNREGLVVDSVGNIAAIDRDDRLVLFLRD